MNVAKLGELIRPAKVKRAGNDSYPLLSMTMRRGLIPQGEKFKKRVAGADLSQYKVIEHNQLVVGFPIDEAVLAFQRSVPAGIVSPAYGVWDLTDKAVTDELYLERYLRSPQAIAFYKAKLQGSTARRRSLPNPVFLDMEVPFPPLEEQYRIAAILDKADELRTKRRQALAHLDTLTQSIFHSMFGEAATSWRETAIEDLADKGKGSVRTGPFGSQLLTSEFTEEGVAVLGIDNAVANEFAWRERRFISFEKYNALRRYTVKPGDLLVTIMGTLGRCAVVPADIPLAINTKHLCCITVDSAQVIPEWLHAYFLRSDSAAAYLRKTTKGAIMGGLNMGIVKKMPVTLPPLELQQTFADRIAAVERLKENHRKHLAELDALFASLQHRAFKGEL